MFRCLEQIFLNRSTTLVCTECVRMIMIDINLSVVFVITSCVILRFCGSNGICFLKACVHHRSCKFLNDEHICEFMISFFLLPRHGLSSHMVLDPAYCEVLLNNLQSAAGASSQFTTLERIWAFGLLPSTHANASNTFKRLIHDIV